MIYKRLDTLTLRRDVSSLCVLYRIYHGECSEELFDLLPAAEFYVHHKISSTPPGSLVNPLLCVFIGTSLHAPRNCGMAYPRQSFQVDIALKAGNAPVAPLVLHGAVGGGYHLRPGDPKARLPCPFPKKKLTLLFVKI